jgi:DNA repair protein RecO (recombination protein O)
MLLAKGRNLDIVTQSQTINGFLALKSDLWRMACGLYILELIDSFTVEGGENRPLFDLSLDILNQLSEPDSNETVLRYFEPLKPVVNFFSPSKGGLLCPHCNSEEDHHYEQIEAISLKPSLPLSVGALKVLRLWQSCDYATAKRVRVKPELSWELERVLCEYIRYILQRELKSLTWLKELKKEIAAM